MPAPSAFWIVAWNGFRIESTLRRLDALAAENSRHTCYGFIWRTPHRLPWYRLQLSAQTTDVRV